MTKIFFTLLWIISTSNTFAADWTWLYWWAWKTVQDIREWNIHVSDFPNMIRYMIDIFLWFAWTIALIFIIIWAYQVAFWSLSDNKTQWKETIIMALSGFVLAAMAWVIIKFILQNLT
jgi:hypothetical protein